MWVVRVGSVHCNSITFDGAYKSGNEAHSKLLFSFTSGVDLWDK